MVRYLKLVLDGFGCFSGRAEFVFAGGIDTMSLPNEAGKSMMLNGLIHTIFGMDKKAKDKYRPWDGAALSRGELALESDGSEYLIRMDFSADRVEVLMKDGTSGLFSELIRRQAHVPGGKRSQAYLEFLSGLFGTAEEDAFRAAYVIEQPVPGDFALGAGKDVLTGQGSALLDGAIKELLERLGKAPDGITRFLDEYDEKSSKQQNDRSLEQLRGKIAEVRGRLGRALGKLDEIQPSKMQLSEAKEALASAKKALKDADERRGLVRKWAALREEYRIKQKDAADAQKFLEAVKREDESLASLRQELEKASKAQLKDAYENNLVASLEKAAHDVEDLLKASEANPGAQDAEGLPSGPGLLLQGAEGALRSAEGEARRAAGELERKMDQAIDWDRQFSEVSSMTGDDRRMLDQRIRSARKMRGSGAPVLKVAEVLAAVIGVGAIAAGILMGRTWLTAAGALVLALGVILFYVFGRIGAGTSAVGKASEDEVAEAVRIAALYDRMELTERPVLPEDAGKRLDELARRAEAADALLVSALQANSRLDAVTAEGLRALADLSGSDACPSKESILWKGDAFWSAVLKENESRALAKEALRKARADVAAQEGAVAKLLSAKGFTSMDKLIEDHGRKMVDAASTKSEWSREYGDDLILKPELDKETLRMADSELKALEEGQRRIQGEVLGLETRVEELEEELKQADSEPLSNIPELNDELELLYEQERSLLSEAEALGCAIRALRRAGIGYSTGARAALEQKATALLQEITEVGRRQVGVREDFKLDVRWDGSGISTEQLSQGTRDQLYISMRLAAASVLEDGRKVPIFMDDSFGTTDGARLARLRRMLLRHASERQFIVLSHSEDVSGWGEPIRRV